MYRFIVKRKVANTFDELSAGNYRALLDQLAESFRYEFVGSGALSGTRTKQSSMTAWFDRLERIFGRLKFTPLNIEVGGPPWDTTVLTEVAVAGKIGQEPYENLFFQRINLRMGKIFEIRTLEDTAHLEAALTTAASLGVEEAGSHPIVD